MGKNHWYLFGEVAMFLTGWSVRLGKNQTEALDEERSTRTAWDGRVWGAVGVIYHDKRGNSSTSWDITWYNHMGSYNYPITVVKYVLINGTAPHRCWEIVWNLLGKVESKHHPLALLLVRTGAITAFLHGIRVENWILQTSITFYDNYIDDWWHYY
jgi:hypothetical protein